MIIHTNAEHLFGTVGAEANLPGVRLRAHRQGSRTHKHAFDVSLVGNSSRRVMAPPNGAGDETAATWDEWGVFFANLFAIDPDARCGGTVKRPVYANGVDFHNKTGGRFGQRMLPADTHQQHRWQYDGETVHCTKCSALRFA